MPWYDPNAGERLAIQTNSVSVGGINLDLFRSGIGFGLEYNGDPVPIQNIAALTFDTGYLDDATSDPIVLANATFPLVNDFIHIENVHNFWNVRTGLWYQRFQFNLSGPVTSSSSFSNSLLKEQAPMTVGVASQAVSGMVILPHADFASSSMNVALSMGTGDTDLQLTYAFLSLTPMVLEP